MLLQEPVVYLKEILNLYPNSYLAEDELQTIIGIDCDYIYGDDLQKLKTAYENGNKICEFAGLFGVMSYEVVHKFEIIGEKKPMFYDFPTYFYANAKAYLHYDKQSKIYSYYGEGEYFANLENVKPKKYANSKRFYHIDTDLNAEETHFKNSINLAKEYIKSGDVFQVVLSQTLKLSSNLDPLEFYEILKRQNPSQYMFYFPTPYGVVTGSSPELIMQIKKGEIFVAPIAGTRGRGSDANEDEKLKFELLNDEKELAEHKMLIDLARNDIGKFAKKGSVKVKNPMHIKTYESVMHIASEVYGTKREDKSAFDVLSIVFPAGTLSGSPKIRAMQIINELEGSSRGVYGGGLGFWHFNGDVQMAILIRSAIFVPKGNGVNDVFVGAGAGIVYDSVPKSEYEEICKKRRSCVKIFEEVCKEI
ncbi:anthranilate synthase component I family protein [Campylobacter hyointestinalis]|uniref:anthranilate synthase component I family protein n=1 Tax=Campylobacter hyointestinalis TaxID=198 RepID=UPI000CE53692|nr:anthranilate synthase component I family protein [Campylobacter hyointestinalis]PPB71683.1 anthranilate synthase component I [Campylobacter hyointestinalis subsp. hyointestinalis]PPB74689.1 anthranilate synthase component I [Campylobacter hyointestinalis subsp. hyointestinalis]PPB76361.1 anthranilate synthase component I [Campylobacter hyointestinalis subsp. hyointestinalis]PPB77921.1 anthranilate synthase component I [Campylobacter hyointestinalis subsp. hyointestinalis]